MVENIKGRRIDAVPYTGLVEALAKITLICHTARETSESLSKQDLLNFLSQIAEIGAEGFVFAGASSEEVREVTNYLLNGLNIGREPIPPALQ
jgi:hypothetical protein